MPALTLRTLRIGTRASALARWQTTRITRGLRAAWPDLGITEHIITTTGDRESQRPLPEMAGPGVFTAALEDALRDGAIDVAVHSLKDLPLEPADGLTLAAVGFREDARDVLVSGSGWALATLPIGGRVGTSSTRRAAQLLAVRPDLRIEPLRGNVDTRVRRALARDGHDAIVLAAAGLLRLGLIHAVSQYLPFEVMLPAPGQGALAVECRAADTDVVAALAVLEDATVLTAVTAERTFLRALGGGCDAPVGAFADVTSDGTSLSLSGMVAAPDGTTVVRVAALGVAAEPQDLGRRLAAEALARGAGRLLT